MAPGTIDESGGGSVHDVDYYTFPAEAINDLILNAEASEIKLGKTEVEGYRYTDYVDWPYGREDGSELHRNNERVSLHLGFKKREDMHIFTISETDPKAEKSDGGNTPPQIGIDGFIISLDLFVCRRNLKYAYKNMVYDFLNDPVVPNFGNLNDLETPCELVFDRYHTPETSSDGDYSEDRRKILYFDKAMTIEALSKIKYGQTVTVKGPGRAVHFLERAGYGYNHNENTVEINIDNKVEVAMGITCSHDGKNVTYDFKSKPVDQTDGFSLSRSIEISDYKLLSSL